MEAKFTLTRKEYEEFLKLAYARMAKIVKGNSKFFIVNVLVWIFLGVAFSSFLKFYKLYDGYDLQYLDYALVALGIGILGFTAVSFYQRKYYLYYSLHENGVMLQEQKVFLTEEGISISTARTQNTYFWPSIQSFEQSDSLMCLYVDNCHALLIPKRAIPDPETLNAMSNFINEHASSSN